jgi:hypothetical protein
MADKILPLRSLSARITLDDDGLRVCVHDPRTDVLLAFMELAPEQQEQLAIEAWRIGLGALMNAQAQAQRVNLEDIGQTLASDFEAQLTRCLESQAQTFTEALRRYFDPSEGQISERLRAFLDDDGVLASKLQRYIGADNSVLAQTLAQRTGEGSPLFKMLSPTHSDGLVHVLQSRIEEAMAHHRTAVAKALDPLEQDGPVARFLRELREQLEKTDGDRNEQLQTALAALDANDEQSLLSRLMRETREAHDALRRAMDPQLPDSPMAGVKKTLEVLIADRLDAQHKRLEELQRSQNTFQQDLRAAVERIETRRVEHARTTVGGSTFEERVVEFASRVVPSGLCTVEAVGSRVGLRPHCRVGDLVVRFSDDSAFAGCGVVIEAKRDGSYSVPAALAELEVARANRDAEVGLFVWASTHAPDEFPGFARYGNNLLVTWDPEDPTSSGLLHGAVVAALGLAQRKRRALDPGDREALADVEQRVIRELERLGKMSKWAGAIERDAGKISDEIRKGRKGLERLVDKAKATLRALEIELSDDDIEAESPIELDAFAPGRGGGAEAGADAAQ